jgi:hypothetical protein
VQEKKATLDDLLALPGDFISKFTAARPSSSRPIRRRYAAY